MFKMNSALLAVLIVFVAYFSSCLKPIAFPNDNKGEVIRAYHPP